MEFWGVEVKAGETLKVSPGEGYVIHLSQASIGDSKKGKSESIPAFVKVGEQKLVIGTLSADKFPQIQYDVVFDKDFELSHNWKNGSVFFCGYKTQNPVDDGGYSGEEFESDSEDEELALENGKPPPAIAAPSKPTPAAKPAKIEDVKADSDEDSSDDDDSDDDSDGDEMDTDDSDDEDDSSEEEEEKAHPAPKKDDKKRLTEAETKAQVSAKKAKLATPQKTDGKKPAAAPHTATPHPAKQIGKTPKNGNSKTPASAGKSHSNAKRAVTARF